MNVLEHMEGAVGLEVTDKAVGLQPGTSPRSQRSCAAKSQQGRLAGVFLGGVAQCGLRRALEREGLTLWGAEKLHMGKRERGAALRPH